MLATQRKKAQDDTSGTRSGGLGTARGVGADQANAMVSSFVGGGAGGAAAAAAPAKQLSKRITPLPAEKNFGEQVVGSHHALDETMPWNIAEGTWATAQASLEGDSFFTLERYASHLPFSGGMNPGEVENHLANPIRIRFKPTKAGEFTAKLKLTVRWGDATETQTMIVRGRARNLDDAPTKDKTPAEIEAQQAADEQRAATRASEEALYEADGKIKEPYNPRDLSTLQLAAKDARTAAGALARAQKRGLNIVSKEAESYEEAKSHAKSSIWWDLAEMALLMGTAGVAGVVAKKLVPQVAAWAAGVDYVGDAKKAVDAANIVIGSADAVKEGLKYNAKKGIKAILPGGGGGGGKDDRSNRNNKHSSNNRIDFFTSQEKALDQAATDNEFMITEREKYLTPVLRGNPKVAVGAMNAIKTTMLTSEGNAEQEQANATASQWVGVVARLNLGSEEVANADQVGEDGVTTTTDLSKARPTNVGDGDPDVKKGLLDIRVDNLYHPIQVRSARLHGVAQEIADRISQIPLINVPMPVRLVIGDMLAEPTMITRDEAGRIRVRSLHEMGQLGRQGRTQYDAPEADAQTEGQANQGAEAFAEQVLSKSLDDWGIPEIKTDDATKRGD